MDSKAGRDPDFTRRQIKIAAKREFNSVGFFATDTNKIAKLAGYAPGTFYRHFKDKIDIFIEIFSDWTHEQMEEIERTLSLGGTVEEMATRLTDILIRFYVNWRPLRAAARVLRISEPRVKESRQLSRAETVKAALALRGRLNLVPITEVEMLLFVILIERLSDAVSDGELDLPNLPQDSGRNALYQFVLKHLQGKQ